MSGSKVYLVAHGFGLDDVEHALPAVADTTTDRSKPATT
jgi:hypothetical protein